MAQESILRDSKHTGGGTRWTAADRIGTLAAGGALVAAGWPWRSPLRVGALIGGGILMYWGVTGDSRLRRFLGRQRSRTKSGVASVHHNKAVRIEKAVTVRGPVGDIYRIWRNPENIPCFARQLISVRAINDMRSHWIARGPAGRDVEWESEIYNQRENESFAWRSMQNADVNHAGSVHFRTIPETDATEVRVILSYEPPAGALGSWVARLSDSDPETQLQEGLLRFKEEFEAGNLRVH